MGNLENDDIEETASLKTITSDINSNETNLDSNSIKSGKLKIKDESSKRRSSVIQNGGPMLLVTSEDDNLENVDGSLVNGISNGNGNVPPENEDDIAKSPNVDKIDTNADVHAEDDSKDLTDIPRSPPKYSDQKETQHKEESSKEAEDIKPGMIVNGSDKTYTNGTLNEDESGEVILNVKNDIVTGSNKDNLPMSPKKEENNSNQMSDSKESSNKPNVKDKNKSEIHFEKSNENISESVDITETNDLNIETQTAVSKPNTFHGEKGNTPQLKKRLFKRSVSDNFLIKSTSTNTSPMDSTNVYNIEMDDAVLIQNNINTYKSEEVLRDLTKLELIKRSISETLEGLKSKLMRSNRVNGSDRNVKLITVESRGRDEDDMIENIRTPHEMKSASLESVADAAVNDSEDVWHTERDVNKGIDVLRRDGSPGNGQPMADPSAPDVVATNDPKNGIVNPAFTPPSLLSQQSTVWSRKQQAVCVRHAFKHYGSKSNPNHVLSNLNMTVAKGTIYGLLGASGCGKTTLLSCIVGRRRLNTGEIWVLGGKPGTKGSGVPGKRVGYMPQEIALYGEFSIKETMMYFGWIFGMETPEIDDRLQFLLNFLDLPSQSRLVKNLSGGQQRRVSFAVALMHDPELLILDEPTVGVDPLLRQSIWNHLVQITKDGNKTVIITTHYIEEARQAHTIGLMRSGRLLAEESPQVLLQTYGCQSLEEVFLKLSRKQGNDAAANNVPEVNISNNITLATLQWGNKTDEPVYVTEESGVVGLMFNQSKEILIQDHANGHFDPNGKSAMMIEEQEDDANCGDCCPLTTKGKTKALLQKNFLRMWRNVGVMLFIFALPVMQVILFCLAIGRDPTGLHLAIVNQEMDWATKACPVLSNCSFTHLSCRYLNSLPNDTIIKDYYPDPESAINAVRVGDAWGALYFTDNFTDALVARMVLGRDADEETLDQSEIRVWLDMSNQQIGLMLNRDLQLSYRDFAQNLLSTCDQNPKIADIPIQFKEPIYGSNDPSFTDFVAPGVILTIVFFLAVALTSSALIIERMEGLLDRSWVAGVTPLEILFSHVITQFVVMCGQTALVLIFMIFVFGVECKGDLLLVIILTILQGLCGMCFGFVISAICELERNAIQLALGSFYPTLLLSGVIWPVEGMPVILRYISLCLPLTMATTSLRSILTRGWNLVEPDVYLGFISTITWIVLFLTISMLVLKFKRG